MTVIDYAQKAWGKIFREVEVQHNDLYKLKIQQLHESKNGQHFMITVYHKESDSHVAYKFSCFESAETKRDFSDDIFPMLKQSLDNYAKEKVIKQKAPDYNVVELSSGVK